MTIKDIQEKKIKGEKITMLTAHDCPSASLIDEAGIDIILVGDSLANVALGLESTKDVGMEEMLHHAKAVRRGAKSAFIVGDMPYNSYQTDTQKAVDNARRFIEEAGCDAVKLEWFDQCLEVAEKIVQAGIPAMGHVGLTPQTAQEFKVQGKDADSAKAIITNAKALQGCGCFSIVLECMPAKIAQILTEELSIPTIGIGAGVHCDGQVLVTHDVLGLVSRFKPKFVKQYVNLNDSILAGLKQYRQEVVSGQFPDEQHSYTIHSDELEKLRSNIENVQ